MLVSCGPLTPSSQCLCAVVCPGVRQYVAAAAHQWRGHGHCHAASCQAHYSAHATVQRARSVARAGGRGLCCVGREGARASLPVASHAWQSHQGLGTPRFRWVASCTQCCLVCSVGFAAMPWHWRCSTTDKPPIHVTIHQSACASRAFGSSMQHVSMLCRRLQQFAHLLCKRQQ